MMIKVSSITRSFQLVDALNEAGTDYAYLDDPEGIRWIIFAGPYRKGLGHFWVYEADRCNVTEKYGTTLYGHQDTVRTIITRANTKPVFLDEAIDLTELVCA